MDMIQSTSCDFHILTKNHAFSINFDRILGRYNINGFSTIKQLRPVD